MTSKSSASSRASSDGEPHQFDSQQRLLSDYDGLVNGGDESVRRAVQGAARLAHLEHDHASVRAMDRFSKKYTKDASHHLSSLSLFNGRVLVFVVLWYFFSFTTLFLNKHVLSYGKSDPSIVGNKLETQ